MFFNKKSYDYQELAKKWGDAVVFENKPEEFYKKGLEFIAQSIQAGGGCLILKSKEVDDYTVRSCLDGRNFSFYPQHCHNLILWLKKNKRGLTRQQILEGAQFLPIRTHALNFFLHFQAEACIPLMDKENLLGLVALSAKKNGKPYESECLNLLNWLAVQFSSVLQNALLQEELRHQKAEREALQDLKSQITANLSHELRTPLTTVIGFAELLAEEIDGPLNNEQKRHIGQVIEGGERLLKTLSALVDMAKLEAGHYPINISQFHLVPLLQGISEEINFNSDTALNISLDGQTPFVYGDLQLVRQIFGHLLDNAAKYTPRGLVEIKAGRKGEMLEICIADTGIGIAEEKLSDIFQGFYQASSGFTREYEGPGIGLALSRKLVEAHGGKLWVKSKPGHGSSFYFTLPLKPVAIRQRELAA